MKKTLFLHVPKTGGTTLTQFLRNHFYETNTVFSVQGESSVADLLKISDESNMCVAGHIPAMSVDLLKFEKKITILRDPLDIICSTLAFIKHLGYEGHIINSLLERSEKYFIYPAYFSTGFDFIRLIKEKQFGINTEEYVDYTDETDIDDLITTVSRFDYVFDFNHLNSEIKRLIITEELFPHSDLPNLRKHDYTPDKDAGIKLLSNLDVDFYRKAKKLFVKIPDDIDQKYELYRKQYPARNGITLDKHQSTELDLRKPVGAGWHDAEQSDMDFYFRWSSEETSTIEIPICNPGHYVLHAYLHTPPHHQVKLESISVSTNDKNEVESRIHENIKIIKIKANINKSGWMFINFKTQTDVKSNKVNSANPDLRSSLNYILSSAILRRVK